MINAVDIEVYGGYYEIVQGMDFGVSSSAAEFVTYEHEGVWYVRGDKCRGRSAQTLIILPDNAQLARFSLTVSDGAFKIDTLSARSGSALSGRCGLMWGRVLCVQM